MGCSQKKLQSDMVIILLVWIPAIYGLVFNRRADMCEPIQIPMCQGMPYNMTRMPNLLHHSSQENAKLSIEQFEKLIEKNCSDVLLFFLCGMYAPICTVNFQPEPIPPCWSVCNRAKLGCERIMNEYNVSWPENLSCDNLPRYDSGVCVSPAAIVSSLPDRGQPTLEPAKESNGRKPDRETTNKTRKKGGCHCTKRPRLKKRLYKKGKFNFAIRARILGHDTANTINTVTRVSVIKVLKSTRVHIIENNGIELWTNSTCVCPKLLRRKEYLILGYDDPATQRLLFFDNCFATKWQKRWEKRISKWNKKRRTCRKKKRKNCRLNRNKNRVNSTGTNHSNVRNRGRENRRNRKKNRINSTSTT
ncbi:secreted frizzled-related protein 3-like [Argopecten irradians]|uniref:secreted frizzled-related protein 3-like n=1 Tax=Argopecten irradians TaxID=31199 RepID=UPI00371C315F